jgi:cation diffusion facilitator CzcD-associated flavoprotein CzcO
MAVSFIEHIPILVIGTGFAGLGMAIRLKQTGYKDFIVLERANEVGGTWRDNSYPGCTCDVESHLYSFSFAPNPRWSRMWSPQPEILEYLKGCAERFHVRPHIRFGVNFEGAVWNESLQHWQVQTSAGEYTCETLISATGPLSEPFTPALKGLDSFRGTTFHSAHWNHSYDLTGKKVAVIGTGASAIQFIPAIQPKLKKLILFQRTAPWVVSYRNRKLTEREQEMMEKFPALQHLKRLRIYLFREMTGLAFRHPALMIWLERLAKRNLNRKIQDPVLREKLTPSYKIGCKRVLISREYYPALAQENVEVVTSAIQEIRRDSIVTTDGIESKLDAIIFGTGFILNEIHGAVSIRGKAGHTLSESWAGSPKAHLGTTVTGFPNLFLLFGPNTGLGHTSVVLMVESQINHVLGALRFMRKKKLKCLEPKAEVQSHFIDVVDKKMGATVWLSGCKSWYLDETGRNSTLWPGSVGAFRQKVEKFRPREYDFK